MDEFFVPDNYLLMSERKLRRQGRVQIWKREKQQQQEKEESDKGSYDSGSTSPPRKKLRLVTREGGVEYEPSEQVLEEEIFGDLALGDDDYGYGDEDGVDNFHGDCNCEYFRWMKSIAKLSDIKSMLFTTQRDYLQRCSFMGDGDGHYLLENVPSKHLDGKLLMIIGLEPPPDPAADRHYHIQTIMKACEEVHDIHRKLSVVKGDFEVVVLMSMTKRSSVDAAVRAYARCYSRYKWLVVPFVESDTLAQKLGLDSWGKDSIRPRPRFLVVDKAGAASLAGTIDTLKNYGPQLYPFTDQRLRKIHDRDSLALLEPSFKNLLSGSTFLSLSPGSEKDTALCFNDFEGKLVGLYLCVDGKGLDTLNEAYMDCVLGGRPFKVVVIYPVTNQDEWKRSHDRFKPFLCGVDVDKRNKKYNWLLMKFNPSVIYRLRRMFYIRIDSLDRFMVMGDGDGYNYVYPYALDVMIHHGPSVDLYPFTAGSVIRKAVKKLADVRLASLLEGVTIFDNVGNPVPLSKIVGCRVLLHRGDPDELEQSQSRSFLSSSWPLLQDLYPQQLQESDSNLRVISVLTSPLDNFGVTPEVFRGAIPWLYVPYNREITKSIVDGLSIFKDSRDSELIAFEADGRISTYAACDHLSLGGDVLAVFSSSNLHKEVAKFFWYDDYLSPEWSHT